MPRLIDEPTRIEAAGNKPKRIEEYVGRVNGGESAVSIAHMRSPSGWVEPGQTPEFDEWVDHREGTLDVQAGQAVVVRWGEWVRYSTPGPDGAEYIAVCLLAFLPQMVHRDESRPGSRARTAADVWRVSRSSWTASSSLQRGSSHPPIARK